MPRRVLLVLPESLRRQGLEDLLRDELEASLRERNGTLPTIAPAGSQSDAGHMLALGFDLVVAHLDIPADSRSCPDEGADRGLEFLKAMRSSGHDTPCILLADAVSGQLLAKARDLPRCELVENGVGLADDLEKAVERVLAEQRPSGQPDESTSTATVEITLDGDLMAYTFRCRGSQPYYYGGRRRIDEKKLKSLVSRTRLIESISTYPGWMEALHNVGEDLSELLIKSDGIFGMHLGVARTMAHGDENLRIRFSIDRDIHPAALEALLNPDRDDQFWMLEAPFSRKLRTPAWRLPLFHDEATRDGPLNCLIIESDVGGYVPGLKNLPELEHVAAECQWLEDFLKGTSGGNRVRFDRVERVSRATVNGSGFRDRVRDLLTDGTEWHVVHYGGHSHYDADKGAGYVFFPDGDRIEPIDIALLVDWLKCARVSFLFLSSCRSSHDAFAFELAHKQVPAIVGFRWEIDDNAAKEHTQIFYKELLTEEPSLERAFQRTRKQMHLKDKQNRIWAAPMMILQITD